MRGAWIEIAFSPGFARRLTSLPVRGAWIEMLQEYLYTILLFSRSPCGERGLKFYPRKRVGQASKSLPVRGAWIEIVSKKSPQKAIWSLPVRGAWIEM